MKRVESQEQEIKRSTKIASDKYGVKPTKGIKCKLSNDEKGGVDTNTLPLNCLQILANRWHCFHIVVKDITLSPLLLTVIHSPHSFNVCKVTKVENKSCFQFLNLHYLGCQIEKCVCFDLSGLIGMLDVESLAIGQSVQFHPQAKTIGMPWKDVFWRGG